MIFRVKNIYFYLYNLKIKTKIIGDHLETKKILESIEINIEDKYQITNNLKNLLEIAKVHSLRSVFEWARWELYGYKEIEALPQYRKLNVKTHKQASTWVKEREYEEVLNFINPIEEVVKFFNYEFSKYDTTNIWGTPITYFIPQSEFYKILDGVIGILKETMSKIKRDLNAVPIDLNFIEDDSYREYKSKLRNEEFEISQGCLDKYLTDDNEKEIFINNIRDLLKFEYEHRFKFCMVMMGSILEFLLDRYCDNNNIPKKREFFANINTAIQKDIFGEKMRWKIVQSHLRDFRNCIHINKEMKSTIIDESWYNTIKPVFEVLYKKFKS